MTTTPGRSVPRCDHRVHRLQDAALESVVGLVAAGAVQQVGDGETGGGFLVAVRQVDHELHRPAERGAGRGIGHQFAGTGLRGGAGETGRGQQVDHALAQGHLSLLGVVCHGIYRQAVLWHGGVQIRNPSPSIPQRALRRLAARLFRQRPAKEYIP
ncbi:hypothetical protein [Ramlibacter sp.]|uniref:hypothetical protein n=1 Tax=Ramlibacter sp. TaxID=1917967 RepID=UPI003441DBEA